MNENKLQKKEPVYRPPVNKFQIYGILVCGLIMILIGIYLTSINVELSGYSNRKQFHITGPATTCLGIAILIFPFYILIKQYKEKKKFDRNIF